VAVFFIVKMKHSVELEPKDKELPRWVQIFAGSVLGLFTLLCGLASLSLLITPHKQRPILAIIVGVALLLGCV
jgi:hypothetical protein